MKAYQREVCDLKYDEHTGILGGNIASGLPLLSLPKDCVCSGYGTFGALFVEDE